jgi:hypothetical protein
MDSFKPIDRSLFDFVHKSPTGYPEDLAKLDTREALYDVCGNASRDFPQSLWIEEKDRVERARQNDANKTWAMNYRDRFTMQDPTHECTTHSYDTNFCVARNRHRGIIYPDGPKKDFRYEESAKAGSVWTSCLSIYAEANPRQWGGANVQQVLNIGVRRGSLPDKIQPRDYGFKHTLQSTTGRGNNNQSSGPWVSVRNFPEGWEETAKHFRPLEVVFPKSYEEALCLLLHGFAVSVGRSGHAVPWCQWLPGQGAAYPDSYNIVRYDSERTMKSAWRGSFAIITTTKPDDWSKPAG